MENLFPFLIGCLYILLGLIGLILNMTTCIMIWSKRVYRLSAYTLMSNVAFSDSIMLIVIGIGCGFNTILYIKSTNNNNTNFISNFENVSSKNQLINSFITTTQSTTKIKLIQNVRSDIENELYYKNLNLKLNKKRKKRNGFWNGQAFINEKKRKYKCRKNKDRLKNKKNCKPK